MLQIQTEQNRTHPNTLAQRVPNPNQFQHGEYQSIYQALFDRVCLMQQWTAEELREVLRVMANPIVLEGEVPPPNLEEPCTPPPPRRRGDDDNDPADDFSALML